LSFFFITFAFSPQKGAKKLAPTAKQHSLHIFFVEEIDPG
jgi:hypothetical protein